MPKLTDFKVLTFDCYGTLIDWEAGISKGLETLVAKAGARAPKDVLAVYAAHEAAQERETPAMPYSQLLGVVYHRLAKEWGVAINDQEAQRFGASVPDWPPFPDSHEALCYLKKYYRLVVLSNIDRTSFRASNALLGVEFDAIYTAEEIGSYKPELRNFEYLIEHLKRDFGLVPGDILHTAQSLFHDHLPANQLGLASAWIDRRYAVAGWGATVPPATTPKFDFRFESMAAMAAAHSAAIEAKAGADPG